MSDESIVKHLEIDSVGTVLLKAAAYIEEHGWCQNSLITDDGKVCAMGAIHMICGGGLLPCPTFYAAKERLEQCTESLLSKWNDTPGRTKEEVIAALRAAAV